MTDILLMVLYAILLAIVLGKQIDKILPPLLMGSALLVYALALLLGSLSVATDAVLILTAVFLIAFFIIKTKSGSFLLSEIGTSFRRYVFTVPFLVYIITIIGICISYTGHLVFNWDDLSYWGTYAKTILNIDKIPTALANCTIDYKDYPPIQQILQYMFMHRLSGFNQANLFRVSVAFMYTLMLPFLSYTDYKKSSKLTIALSIALYLIFPHIFTTQFYFKLGIDCLMSVLFGYSVYVCVAEEDDKWFCLSSVIIASSYMAMIKANGAFLCVFITLFYCSYHWMDSDSPFGKIKAALINLLITFVPPMIFYISWKYWGRISQNNGYLSDRISGNVRTLNINFPDYTAEVVLNYIKHIFTYPLTRSTIGMSAAVMILLIALIYHFTKPVSHKPNQRKLLHIFMCVGTFIFCCAHIYMYLFVFDDWEAHGLLEFDRYITQYLAGIFYFYACDIAPKSEELIKLKNRKFNPALVLLIVAICLFPYKSFSTYLIPGNYKTYFEDKYSSISDYAAKECENAQNLFAGLNWTPDESKKIGVIADAWSDELQFLIFDLVPQPISFVFNSPAIEDEKLPDFLTNQARNRNIHYVYVMTNSKESHADTWDSKTSAVTDNGAPLVEGCLYEIIPGESDSVKYKLLR